MVLLFSTTGRIFECRHHTLSISPLFSGLMRDILRFIFFMWRYEKLLFFFLSRLLFPVRVFYCLILSFLLAAKLSVCQIVNYYSTSQTFWRWVQGKVFATGTHHVELLQFSVLGKVLWVKCFSLFYFKVCTNAGIILHKV